MLEPWVAQYVSLPSCCSQFIHMQMWENSLSAATLLHVLSTLVAHLCPSYRSG